MKKTKRLYSIDLLRGIFMTLMTVGHAVYFIGGISHHEFWNTGFSSHTASLWSFIRVICHIAPPGFFFLMGVSIALLTASRLKSGWSHYKINKFLIIRGTFLVTIATLIITPVWMKIVKITTFPFFGMENYIFYFGVLSSLGICMIATSLLTRFHKKILFPIAILGIIIPYIYVNNQPANQIVSSLLSILMLPKASIDVLVYYPIFPWLSLCLFGVIWGKYYLENTPQIFKKTRNIGILLLILFVISRLINIGNFHAINANTIGSFFALIRYPASISLIFFAMGTNLILLSLLSKIKTISQKNPLIIFGKAPLFFYIAHLYLYLLLGLFFPSGASLLITSTVWIIGLLILYPLSTQYIKFKSEKNLNSIWRFF